MNILLAFLRELRDIPKHLREYDRLYPTVCVGCGVRLLGLALVCGACERRGVRTP